MPNVVIFSENSARVQVLVMTWDISLVMEEWLVEKVCNRSIVDRVSLGENNTMLK